MVVDFIKCYLYNLQNIVNRLRLKQLFVIVLLTISILIVVGT